MTPEKELHMAKLLERSYENSIEYFKKLGQDTKLLEEKLKETQDVITKHGGKISKAKSTPKQNTSGK